MGPIALPEITEVKRRLAGPSSHFSCRVVDRRDDRLVVLFVSTGAVQVDDFELPPGTVTFGYFWPTRSYNVYHWMAPPGPTLAFYVNLADDTSFTQTHLHWRDLAVDILLVPGAPARVLDEHELPATLDESTRTRIVASTHNVLNQAQDISAEVDAASSALWPHAFDQPRSR